MAFNMPWQFAPTPVVPGNLPAAATTVYVDFQAGAGGDGTSGAPWNDMPGLTVGDTRVGFGTRVNCRGTWRSSAANFGQLNRAGVAAQPLVYVGNDPSWGSAIIDGAVQLTPAACTSQANAFGNPNWANMRRASIVGLGGNAADDYLHVLYGGADREIRYLAGYPQLSNDDAFDYAQYCPPTSFADVWWYPGINEAAPVYIDGTSRPRLSLVAANTSMGLAAGTLQAALDTDCVPVLQMRMKPNVWFTARVGRCDADGTLNAAGAYITPIDGARLTGTSQYGVAPDALPVSTYGFRILNVAKAIDRAGTYAMNPVAGWLVEWPFGSEAIYRAQGKSGLEFNANHVWLHGFKICGMSTSNTVADATGADGGNSLQTSATVDETTIRIQRCQLPAFGSIGGESRQQAFDNCGHAKRYYNSYSRQAIGSAILISTGAGADVRFNDFQYIHGSNVRIIGAAVRNVLVSGNRIEHVNDLHGNGITLYACKYDVTIRGNLIKDCGRPLTSERNDPYDTATYGAPSCLIDGNVFVASGSGTAAAARWQGPDEIGLRLSNNSLDGGLLGDTPFTCHASLSTVDNTAPGGNRGVGAAITGSALTMWNAGAGNAQYTRASAPGIALIAELAALTVPDVVYAPKGVGHLAGGWDGNS